MRYAKFFGVGATVPLLASAVGGVLLFFTNGLALRAFGQIRGTPIAGLSVQPDSFVHPRFQHSEGVLVQLTQTASMTEFERANALSLSQVYGDGVSRSNFDSAGVKRSRVEMVAFRSSASLAQHLEWKGHRIETSFDGKSGISHIYEQDKLVRVVNCISRYPAITTRDEGGLELVSGLEQLRSLDGNRIKSVFESSPVVEKTADPKIIRLEARSGNDSQLVIESILVGLGSPNLVMEYRMEKWRARDGASHHRDRTAFWRTVFDYDEDRILSGWNVERWGSGTRLGRIVPVLALKESWEVVRLEAHHGAIDLKPHGGVYDIAVIIDDELCGKQEDAFSRFSSLRWIDVRSFLLLLAFVCAGVGSYFHLRRQLGY